MRSRLKSYFPSGSLSLPPLETRDKLIALGFFLLFLVLFIRTAGASLGGLYDSEEYQWSAYALDFAPSTGYPLYMLLGKLWVTLVPFGDVAHRMNLLSGVFAACALGLFYLNARLLTGDRWAAGLTTIWLGTNSAYWFEASVAAVSPLHLLLLNLILLTLLLWAAGRARLEWVGLLIGLSLAHHRSTVVILPAILLFIFLRAPNVWRERGTVLRTVGLAVLPLLLYAYIPFTADPSVDRNYIWSQILAGASTENSAGAQLMYLQQILQLWYDWLSPLGIALLAIGASIPIFRWTQSALRSRAVSLLLFGAVLPLAILPVVRFLEVERYALVVFTLLLFWVAGGIYALRDAIAMHVQPHWARVGLNVAVIVLVVAWLGFNLPNSHATADASANTKEYKFWDQVMSLPLEPNARILVNWSELNSLQYFQKIEGRRTDLIPVRVDQDNGHATEEVAAALKAGQAVYLTPSSPEPNQAFRYGLVGPLLRVYAKPLKTAPALPVTLPMTFTTDIGVVGYGVGKTLDAAPLAEQVMLAPNDSVRVGLNWLVKKTLADDVSVRLRLVDDQKHLWAEQKEKPVRGFYPPSAWKANEIVSDGHGMLIVPGTPPGDYTLQVALVDDNTKTATPIVELPHIVHIQRAPVSDDQVFVRERMGLGFGNDLTLLGGSLYTEQVPKDGNLSFALAWAAEAQPAADYTAHLRLADGTGKTVAEWKDVALVRNLPTTQWQAGDALRNYYNVTLPTDAPKGELALYVSVQDGQGKSLPVYNAPWSESPLHPYLLRLTRLFSMTNPSPETLLFTVNNE